MADSTSGSSEIRFFSYSSIANVENDKIVRNLPEEYANKEWVAEEKIHGANFSFTFNVSTKEIIPGKRSSFLSATSKFYSHAEIYERYSTSLIQLFEEVLRRFDDMSANELVGPSSSFDELTNSIDHLDSIIIYGEIFGGIPKKNAVQVGVFYCSHNEFIPFDIAITFKDNKRYLNYLESRQLFKQFNFLPVPIIATGKLPELLALSKIFESKVPLLFDSDTGIGTGNYAEGYVLRPVENFFVRGHRAVFKYKNPQFSEIKPRVKQVKFSQVNLNDVNSLYKDVQRYITQNRVNNILSHGVSNNPNRLAGLLVADIIKEYPWTFDLSNLSEPEAELLKTIKSKLYQECLRFV